MEERNISKTRFNTGIFILVFGFSAPLFIPWVVSSGLSAAWKTTLSAALAFGIPEVFMLLGIGILGKQGYEYLKGLLKRVLADLVPDQVSSTRYRIGLVMFIIPATFSWLAPYLMYETTFYESNRMLFNISVDVVFFLSFFVLGGDFWDKFRSLFVQKVTVRPKT